MTLPILSTTSLPLCLNPTFSSSSTTAALPSASSSRLLLGTSYLLNGRLLLLGLRLLLPPLPLPPPVPPSLSPPLISSTSEPRAFWTSGIQAQAKRAPRNMAKEKPMSTHAREIELGLLSGMEGRKAWTIILASLPEAAEMPWQVPL